MPYRLRYDVWVDFIPAGTGLGMTTSDVPGLNTWGGPGAPQTLGFGQLTQPTSSTFTNADVVALLAAMTADLTAQMEASATQTRIQNFGANTFPATG